MKGFLQEYGIIMVVVAIVLGMLAFGKTGYAKSIQNAILGSADHIVETGENITKSDKKEANVKAGDTLDIKGTKYIVLEQRENSQALIMTANSIGRKEFQSSYDSHNLRPDGQNANTYEGSDIDKYLETTWYKGLSTKMQSAIQTTSIKQASYAVINDPDSKQETGPNGQVYNTISRHAFLPSVSEIGKAVDLKSPDKVKVFLNGTSIWTRDSYQFIVNCAEPLSASSGSLGGMGNVVITYGVRPAFVIDLSKVDYKVAGHVDYK